MKRGDFVVIFLILCVAVGIFAAGSDRGGSVTAILRQGGQEIKRVSLGNGLKPLSVTVNGKYTNVICFEGDFAYFESSDCPNKTCVHFGRLKRGGQSAICVENRVTLTLESSDALDAVVK